MHNKFNPKTGLAVLIALALGASGCAGDSSESSGSNNTPAKGVDYTALSPEQLAEHLIFEAGGFKLDQETQEGGTVRDRLTQDELQMTCSALRGDERPSAEMAKKVRELAQADMAYPEGGIKLGNWENGAKLARSGYGFRVGHNTDTHSANRLAGGNCYACHQIDPKETTYGTIGPSLLSYGKLRGSAEPIVRYTYEMIYNPHAHYPCTRMPRFGANEFLNQDQVADILAYLLDPNSPVNQ